MAIDVPKITLNSVEKMCMYLIIHFLQFVAIGTTIMLITTHGRYTRC